MSETKKKKRVFNIETVVANATTVKEIPKIAHRGKKKFNWKPLVDAIVKKGILKLSEDDVVIGSAINGVLSTAKEMNINICANTRRENGKTYVYFSKAKA